MSTVAATKKLSGPPPPALANQALMFQQVADLLSWRDLDTPFHGHITLFGTWKEATEQALGELLEASDLEFTEAEEHGFEAVKGMGYALLQKFAERAEAVGWGAQPAETRRAAAEALLHLPQIPQRTPEWYAQGKQVLTASEFATLLKTPRAFGQLVLSKAPSAAAAAAAAPQAPRLACLTCEMGPFDWGIRFEPVVKQILEKEGGLQIAETGRLVHPSHPGLAASPDGLILGATDPRRIGRLIEIKCPITRKVGEGIPFEYWCQMQIQMEVTGIEECEYVEMKIQSPQKGIATEPFEPEGHAWLLQNPTTAEMRYAYTEAEKEALVGDEASPWDLLEEIPWRLAASMRRVVARDRAWFDSTRELQAKFWADVEVARRGTYVAAPSSRAPRTPRGLQITVTKEGGGAGAPCDFLPDDTGATAAGSPHHVTPAPAAAEDAASPVAAEPAA